jgi:hypothetical protein
LTPPTAKPSGIPSQRLDDNGLGIWDVVLGDI